MVLPEWSPEVWAVVVLIVVTVCIGGMVETSLNRIIGLLAMQRDSLTAMSSRLDNIEVDVSRVAEDVGTLERSVNPPNYD